MWWWALIGLALAVLCFRGWMRATETRAQRQHRTDDSSDDTSEQMF